MSLRDALSLMLTSGASSLVVHDERGEPVGMLTVDVVSRLLAGSPEEVRA
jgi:CBS domain-containing protein